MSEKQPEALRLADALEALDKGELTRLWRRDGDPLVIAMLRSQHGRITELEAWKAKIIRSSERAYGESAIRYKFSLTRTGKCMNTFPKEIDGRWFALTPAEDDGHIGHIARIDALEADRRVLREALATLSNHLSTSIAISGMSRLELSKIAQAALRSTK